MIVAVSVTTALLCQAVVTTIEADRTTVAAVSAQCRAAWLAESGESRPAPLSTGKMRQPTNDEKGEGDD